MSVRWEQGYEEAQRSRKQSRPGVLQLKAAPAPTHAQKVPAAPAVLLYPAPLALLLPDSRCQMCRGETQVWRPREDTATASSPPPGSPGIALSGCSVCARMDLRQAVQRQGQGSWGGWVPGSQLAIAGTGQRAKLPACPSPALGTHRSSQGITLAQPTPPTTPCLPRLASPLAVWPSMPTHPHFRKGIWGMGYLEGSCRNSAGMPPATLAPPPWLVPPPVLPAGRPGVAAPLVPTLASALPAGREWERERKREGARRRVASDCGVGKGPGLQHKQVKYCRDLSTAAAAS